MIRYGYIVCPAGFFYCDISFNTGHFGCTDKGRDTSFFVSSDQRRIPNDNACILWRWPRMKLRPKYTYHILSEVNRQDTYNLWEN
jgi:hypothetical protein